MSNVINLDQARSRRRLAQFTDTLEFWVVKARHACDMASATEDARNRYLAGLPDDAA